MPLFTVNTGLCHSYQISFKLFFVMVVYRTHKNQCRLASLMCKCMLCSESQHMNRGLAHRQLLDKAGYYG